MNAPNTAIQGPPRFFHFEETSEGSFSAASGPIFAKKYNTYSFLQDCWGSTIVAHFCTAPTSLFSSRSFLMAMFLEMLQMLRLLSDYSFFETLLMKTSRNFITFCELYTMLPLLRLLDF